MKEGREGGRVLAGVAQWIKCWSVNQEVTHRFDYQSGHMPGLRVTSRSPVGGV